MDQTPETPVSKRRWTRRRKGLLISGLVVLLLILVAVGVAIFYVRSGRINQRIVSEVQTALTGYGLRAEVGGLDIAWGLRTGKVRDVKIYNAQTDQLIATVDQAELALEIPNPFALRLQREVIFKTLHLDNLQAYVEIDEQGISNFQGIHAPPPSAPSRITFDFSSLVASIDGGTVHLKDRARKIEGDLGKLKVNAQPIAGESKINLVFNAGEGRLNYEGRETTLETLELAGRLSDAGAEIDRLAFRSPIGDISVNGRVEDFNALRYNFDVDAQLILDEVQRVFLPDTKLQGAAAFNGNINGEGKGYKINGRLSSDDLTAAGARMRGANIEEVTAESDGERITFSSRQATANSVVAQKNQLANITASGLQGTIINGRTEANLQQINIARITLEQGQLAGVALRNIKANINEDGRTEAQVQQVNAARLDIAQGQISGIALSGVKANLQGERFQVTGGLNLNGGQVSGAQIGQASGQLSANNTTVTLNKFTAAVLGGTAAGDVSVQIAGNGASRLKANLTDVKTNQLFSLLEVKENRLAGSVNGQFDVTWPGTQFEIVSGSIKAQFSGETTQTANAIPVNGDVSVTAQSGAFNVEQLALSTPASQVTATGHLTRKGDSDLRFSLTSTDATELQTIAYSIPDVEKSLADYKPRLAGAFSFEGSVTGSITDPAIEGDLKAADVGMRDRTIGSLTGHVRLTPTDVAFENATLAVADGGTAKFSYAAPRAAVATDGRLDATLDRINVETLTAAAGLSSQQQFISGVLSGEAHLTGLPGSPTGTATVNLLDGTLAGQTADLATANLVFDGKTARLERSEIRLAQGQLIANGNFDLKTNDFQLQGNADNVDLGQLTASLNVTTVVTGVANATFQARGNSNDIGELNVELKAQGQNVTINGKDAGTLSLTAHTNPGGRVDIDLITGIAGKPQPLRASIELRRPGRPIDVQANLEDFDLVPLINAFAPDLASSIAGVVNGKLHVSGPIVNEQGETTLDGLRGDLTFSTIALQIQGRAINIQTPLAVTLNGPQLALSQTRITGQGIDLSLGGTLGLDEGAKLNFAINGSANLDSIGEISPDLFLGGTVAIDARLDGTVSDPRLAGEIQATNLSFTGIDLPVSLENGNGRIVLAGDKITLESFTARANDGTFSINGAVNLEKLQPKDWRFVANANNVDVFYQGAQAVVNGNFELTGTPDGQLLSGNVSIPEGEYTTNLDLASLTGGGGGSVGLSIGDGGATSGSSGAFGLPPINLDVHIEAPNTLLIRNQQINTVASAAITINGTIDDPGVVGRVGVEGGTIKLRSQRYEITTGTIDFPVGGATPVVNILTEGDVSGYHIYLGLQGQIDAMDVTLRADPDLPRSEILSLVATGKIDSSTLGSEDILASGLGTAASLLSDEFISQPLQSLLGLSRFQIDPVLEPNDNPAARLTVGKQLTRDLAFTYSSNVGSEQDASAILEYTLTNRFSALASYTQGGSTTNGARTNTDVTLEIRGRRRFSLGFRQPPAQTTGATVVGTNLLPPRIERTPKPPADVVVNKPENIKVRQAKLDELLPVKKDGYSRALARLGERNLANYLQEQGYFFATVRSSCDPADCSGAKIKLVYDVQPGTRYDLDEIRIEGTDELDVSDVSANLQSKPATFFGSVPVLKGLPLIGGLARGITSDDRIRRDRETIRSRMADLGYRRARVTARTEPKPNSNDLTLIFTVEQGERAMVAEVLFRGNSVFSSKELREAMAIKEEEPFSPSQARESRQNIRNLYSQKGFLETTAQYAITDLDNERVRLVYEITEGSRALIADIKVTGQTKTREASIARFFDFKPGETFADDLRAWFFNR
jgi:autotransporter translocation and assembly factor TamB